MKCSVTGGSGFIGSHLVEKLLEHGHDVTVIDSRKPVRDVAWIETDLASPRDLSLKSFDAVFHLAGMANARECGRNPLSCYEASVIGTINVAEAAQRDGVKRVLLASSAWVATAQPGDDVDENTPFDVPSVNTVYTGAKLAQEMICYSYFAERGGPEFTTLRFGTPYGERMWKGLAVRAFMESAERDKVITILGDGKQYREFLYVGDMCEAQVLALAPNARNKIYNLTGDQPVTVEELAREVAKHFPATIRYVPQTRAEPRVKRIRNDRAKSELGWEIKTSFADGIARCAQWWRRLPENEKRPAAVVQ
jgi:UDP-glucose 4-epimerase